MGTLGWWALEVLAIVEDGDLGGGAGGLALETDVFGPDNRDGGRGDDGTGKEVLDDLELGGGAGGLEPPGVGGGCE